LPAAAGPPPTGAPTQAPTAVLAALRTESAPNTPAAAGPLASAAPADPTTGAEKGTAEAETEPAPATATQPAGNGAAGGPAERVVWDKDLMTLVYIPPGEFLFGAADTDPIAREDERPQMSVYLDGYWIDRSEVTVAQFQEFVSNTGYVTDAERGCCDGEYGEPGGLVYAPGPQYVGSANWRLPQGGGAQEASPRHPVVQVSWNDASAYCAWAGRRLPTEAEWEKAARGADGRLFPWGDDFDGQRLNFCDRNCTADWKVLADDAFPRTGPVGTFDRGASPYDVVDLAGNAWEWVSDFYDFRGHFRVPTANPTGLDEGVTHVLRGGSWLDTADRVRATSRHHNLPDARDNLSGFRCAVSTLPAPAGQ
jgi:formylglycine-generating enzyme required for sulfatase activity